MNDKYKRFAALGLIPFLMSGCGVKKADIVEPMSSTKSIDEIHDDFYDVYVTVVQTDKGVTIDSNNPVVEDILKKILPYDLSVLNINKITITRARDRKNNSVWISIYGKKETLNKYSAEEFLDSLITELIDNNIADKNGIDLNIGYYEFDNKTSFPNNLDILSINDCTGILNEKEVISRDSVFISDCDLFLLDKEKTYPKIETLYYCPFAKEINIGSTSEYLQQIIDYISPFCKDDYHFYITPSLENENVVSYDFDLSFIPSMIGVVMCDDNPVTMDIRNVNNIEFDVIDENGRYNPEKSDFLNGAVKKQFEEDKSINITVSNIGNEPSIYLGSNKKISN